MTTAAEQEPTIDEQIGARLRDARLQVVLTQDELARALGLDRSTVAKWETGQRSMTVENLIRAAAVLEIPPQQLLIAPSGDRPVVRSLSEVIIQHQAVQTIAQTLEQRPDAIPAVVAALKRWAQSGQAPSESSAEDLHGSYSARTIVNRLQDVDITVMTPIRALQMLDELQQLSYQNPSTIETTEQ
ncbi:MAG TPA: helix-turn-helix transcriptional regulator [Roseiflexaceae bacterium]|jgi:transcriptional regulator with XRE-family HTH domain